MFVDRETEIDLLERRFASDRAELFVLYGRRRVGKTELLARFCRGKRHVFFVADQVPEQEQRRRLSGAINEVAFGSGAAGAVYESWDDLLATLADAAQTERLVVVLDEFPYLAAAYPPVASILQRYWDRRLTDGRIMLILNGSYIGMMEETVLGYRAPLYGRRTVQYLLEPFDFWSASHFFGGFDAVDRLRAYAVYGGTPAYLQTVRSEDSLDANIVETALTRGGTLYDEVRFVLQQELREPRNYFAVLQAIAAGNTRRNEIKQAAGVENIAPYLDTLQQLHLIERVVPITETQPHKSRRGVYRVKDNFVRFWFRFVLPNRSQLERGGAQAVFETTIRPRLDDFSSPVFEQVSRDYFWRIGAQGHLPFRPVEVGSWWDANHEIDVVILGESDVMFVECKWSRKPVGVDILRALEATASSASARFAGRTIHFGLCSRAGFTPAVERAAEERDEVHLYEWEGMAE